MKAEINLEKLLALLFDQPWHKSCEIVPDYMPPNPRPDTKPTVQVRCNNDSEYPAFLRYSNGPKQEYFWDIYGDNMHTVELAVFSLSRAPAPRSVAPITFTIPLRK